jgi:hypothetical protein
MPAEKPTPVPAAAQGERPESIREFVRRRLNESRARAGSGDPGWSAVSRATGVPYWTIAKVAQGATTNPRAETLEPLLDYFDYLGTHRRPLQRAA